MNKPCCRCIPLRGFTLVEILVVVVILSVFLGGAYSLFFGGQKVAGKAAWLQCTATDLRQAEQVITKAIQTTSYPSTLLPTAVVDAGGTSAAPGPNSSIFYVHIPLGTGKKSAADLANARNGLVMYMPKCAPEKQGFGAPDDRVGSMTWMVLRMLKSPDKDTQGTLIYEERPTTYSTTGPGYATNCTGDPNSPNTTFRMELVRNVSFVTIDTVPGHTPPKITLTITAAYPRDAAVIREGTSAAVPNVGVAVP